MIIKENFSFTSLLCVLSASAESNLGLFRFQTLYVSCKILCWIRCRNSLRVLGVSENKCCTWKIPHFYASCDLMSSSMIKVQKNHTFTNQLSNIIFNFEYFKHSPLTDAWFEIISNSIQNFSTSLSKTIFKVFFEDDRLCSEQYGVFYNF